MTLSDLLTHYKTYYRMHKEFGISAQSPYYWKKIGYIPLAMQLKIEKKTNGLFKASIHRTD